MLESYLPNLEDPETFPRAKNNIQHSYQSFFSFRARFYSLAKLRLAVVRQAEGARKSQSAVMGWPGVLAKL